MRTRHTEYLNCNYKDPAFTQMFSLQVSDLKIHIGTNGKYQSNLHLEAGKRQSCFLLDAIIEVGVGKKREEKNNMQRSREKC